MREHCAEQKHADAERSGSHPNVIVRRRRKDADKADAPEVTEAAPAAREEVAPPAEEKPAAVEAPAQAEPVAEAPAASPHKVEEKAAPEAAKAEPAEKAKRSKSWVCVCGSRDQLPRRRRQK